MGDHNGQNKGIMCSTSRKRVTTMLLNFRLKNLVSNEQALKKFKQPQNKNTLGRLL